MRSSWICTLQCYNNHGLSLIPGIGVGTWAVVECVAIESEEVDRIWIEDIEEIGEGGNIVTSLNEDEIEGDGVIMNREDEEGEMKEEEKEEEEESEVVDGIVVVSSVTTTCFWNNVMSSPMATVAKQLYIPTLVMRTCTTWDGSLCNSCVCVCVCAWIHCNEVINNYILRHTQCTHVHVHVHM